MKTNQHTRRPAKRDKPRFIQELPLNTRHLASLAVFTRGPTIPISRLQDATTGPDSPGEENKRGVFGIYICSPPLVVKADRSGIPIPGRKIIQLAG